MILHMLSVVMDFIYLQLVCIRGLIAQHKWARVSPNGTPRAANGPLFLRLFCSSKYTPVAVTDNGKRLYVTTRTEYPLLDIKRLAQLASEY
jgi:hypothetical protein